MPWIKLMEPVGWTACSLAKTLPESVVKVTRTLSSERVIRPTADSGLDRSLD